MCRCWSRRADQFTGIKIVPRLFFCPGLFTWKLLQRRLQSYGMKSFSYITDRSHVTCGGNLGMEKRREKNRSVLSVRNFFFSCGNRLDLVVQWSVLPLDFCASSLSLVLALVGNSRSAIKEERRKSHD